MQEQYRNERCKLEKYAWEFCLISVVRSVNNFIYRCYFTTQKSFIYVINWLGRKTFIKFGSSIHFLSHL